MLTKNGLENGEIRVGSNFSGKVTFGLKKAPRSGFGLKFQLNVDQKCI